MTLPTPQPHARILRVIAPQLALLGLILILQVGERTGALPSANVLVGRLSALLSQYGWPLVASASFLENLVGVGTYFPGSVVLLAAMMASAGNPTLAIVTYLAVVIPAVAANLVCFAIGRSTSVREEQTEPKKPRSLAIWYLTTYWHPQLAALTAMAAGNAGIPFSMHVQSFLPISLGWSVFWAMLLYNIGQRVNASFNWGPLVVVYLIGWIAWKVFSHNQSRRSG